MRIKSLYIFTLCIISLSVKCNSEISDSLFSQALQKSDTTFIRHYLDSNLELVNKPFGDFQVTPLVFCIRNNNFRSVAFLIKEYEVNMNNLCQGMTPLMHASSIGNTKIIKLLLANNCHINTQNSVGNTAFIYASKHQRLESLKQLFEAGAKINLTNSFGYTALDFSIINNNKKNTEYLLFIGAKTFPKTISSTIDGPYMQFVGANKIESVYLKFDSLQNRSELTKIIREIDNSRIIKTGYENDHNSYYVPSDFTPEPSEFSGIETVFAIGDIHGEFDRMIKMLKHARVIDDSLTWSFNNGHVVFIGDILDRGNKVTEALWFIYRLEHEAGKHGGKVHLLLGNHELMVMRNDLRYVAHKYYALTSNLNLDYTNLFNNNTVLGKWLRSKNSAVKINDNLFVHAGISPKIYKQKLSIDSINSIVHSVVLNRKKYPEQLEYEVRKSHGPLWYRGYFSDERKYNKITEDKLDEILNFYNVSRIVVGHTEFETIKPHFNNKVISINLPLWKKEIHEQAILIKNGKYYHLSTKTNNKKLLFK